MQTELIQPAATITAALLAQLTSVSQSDISATFLKAYHALEAAQKQQGQAQTAASLETFQKLGG
jgi:hypothetical protein